MLPPLEEGADNESIRERDRAPGRSPRRQDHVGRSHGPLHPPDRETRRPSQRRRRARLRPRPPAGARRGSGRRRRAARPAHHAEGIDQRGRPRHDVRRARMERLRLAAGRAGDGGSARGRRGGAWQDERAPDARGLTVRQSRVRAREQSVGSRAHAGRKQRRQRGGDRGRADRARGRLGHRRIDPRAGGVLRRLELALSILAGPDVGEDVAWRVELPPARHTRLAEFRVGVLPPIPWLPVDDHISSALEQLATKLGALGCTVKRVQPDGMGDWRQHHALYRTLLAVMTGARADEATRRQRIAWSTQHDSEFNRAGRRGTEGWAGDYILWNTDRERYRAAWRAFFRDWDVLLAPAINVLAYPHIERAWPMDDSDFTLTFDVGGAKG